MSVLLTGQDNEPRTGRIVPLSERFDPVVQSYAYIIPNLKPVKAVNGVRAQDCQKCHKTIYQEWSTSTHSSALRDIQFQAELTKENSPRWVCLNCHAPVQNQREFIVTGLEDRDIFKPVLKRNPQFDPVMQHEAITCATCHVRPDAASGESVVIGPNGSPFAPHPVRQDPQFLRSICLRCHDPKGEGLTRNLICWFMTKDELEEGQPRLMAEYGQPQDCVSCHMPQVTRRLADDFTDLPERPAHQHTWIGGGIPKWYEGYDTLIKYGFRPALQVQVHLPEKLQTGDSLSATIDLSNSLAGHYLPTGDPERFILALALLVDKTGNILERRQLRIGQTWQWDPAKKIGDDRLAYGETRTWKPDIRLPQNLQGLQLVVEAYHCRLTAENASYLMQAENVDEKLFPGGAHFVANATDYYPFATLIFREEIELAGLVRHRYSLSELLEISKLEKGKSLTERRY